MFRTGSVKNRGSTHLNSPLRPSQGHRERFCGALRWFHASATGLNAPGAILAPGCRVEEGARPPVNLFPGRPGLLDAIKKPPVTLAQIQIKHKPGLNHCREDRPGRIFSGISLPSPNSGVSYLRKCTARTSQGRPGRFNGPGRWVCTSSAVKIAPGANSDQNIRL